MYNAGKFLELVEETYLINTWEIGPLDKPIMDPTQWIKRIYDSEIMNLLDIPHFKHGKKFRLCIKQLLAWVHDVIL